MITDAASLLRESSWNGVREIEANGYLANYNTIEHFKESNKADRLKEGCEIVRGCQTIFTFLSGLICTWTAEEDDSLEDMDGEAFSAQLFLHCVVRRPKTVQVFLPLWVPDPGSKGKRGTIEQHLRPSHPLLRFFFLSFSILSTSLQRVQDPLRKQRKARSRRLSPSLLRHKAGFVRYFQRLKSSFDLWKSCSRNPMERIW